MILAFFLWTKKKTHFWNDWLKMLLWWLIIR